VQIGYGNAGWVRVDGIGLPGPLYLRLRPGRDGGRWRVTEVYLDGRDEPITDRMLRDLDVDGIEGVAQMDRAGLEQLSRRDEYAGPLLSVLASFYATTFGRTARGWVSDMWRSQFPDSGVRPVRRASDPPLREVDEPARLTAPDGRVTDDFLRELARSYSAALQRGDRRPAVTLAEQAGVSVHAVRKWVLTARQRGIMPRARPGKAG
jgi:hypothetical protein